MFDQACYRCGQVGHLRVNCPQGAPVPAPEATAQPAPPAYRREDTIECPSCSRDWVAIFESPTQFLESMTCPWCRAFEIRDGDVYRRDVALVDLRGQQ